MSRIFINYRRQDTEGYVGRLYDHLLKHFERDVIFMDVDSIQPGVDFAEALEQAVAACDVFIAMIGPQWLNVTDESGERRLDQWNDFVRLEIASALKLNKTVMMATVPTRPSALSAAAITATSPASRIYGAVKNSRNAAKDCCASSKPGATSAMT